MIKEDKIIKPFFSHDYAPLEDKNLLKVFMSMGAEGYGIYWLIVEYMHQNKFFIGEEEILAFKFRVDLEKILKIMNDFELFRIENNQYISDRILRNLNYVEEKNDTKRKSANIRWLLSAFNKNYTEFFGEAPILSTEEIENLKKYNDKIVNFKDKLRDILYTLRYLKFDKDINFKPCANWLLKDNNLGRLVNGEFGPLKHKETKEEIKQKAKEEQEAKNKIDEFDLLETKLKALQTKKEVLNFIKKFYEGQTISFIRNRAIIIPTFRPFMEQFGIVDEDLRG